MGTWAVEAKEGLYRLNEFRLYTYVMVLLEQPLDTIYRHLIEFFDSILVKADVYELFPFEDIVRAGFEQKSEYWAELAFSWYQELPQKIKNSLIDSNPKIVGWQNWGISKRLRNKGQKEESWRKRIRNLGRPKGYLGSKNFLWN